MKHILDYTNNFTVINKPFNSCENANKYACQTMKLEGMAFTVVKGVNGKYYIHRREERE